MDERVNRARAVMLAEGLDALLLCAPANVTYLSGHVPTIEVGVSPFSGPSAVLLQGAGEPSLLLPEVDPGQSVPRAGIIPHTYASYSFEAPLNPGGNMAAAAVQMIGDAGLSSGRLGVESRHLTWGLAASLGAAFPHLELVDVERALLLARMVKMPEEVAAIRRAVALSDIGQQRAIDTARPGMTEAELWGEVRGAMETAAGRRLAVWADLCAGPVTATSGAFPSGRPMASGDMLMVDLSPCLEGYWGDSCNCAVVGARPSDLQRRMFEAAHSTLLEITAAIRPGVLASDLDRLCRERLAGLGWQLPHHTGHGLGTTFHDEPRLTPYDHTPLEAGMVLAIEPGVYDAEAGVGIRTEHIVEVRADGAEVLTAFRHTLETAGSSGG